MSIFSKLADLFKSGHGEVRPENATYSDAVMDAFGVTPGASGISVNPISAQRVSAVAACRQKIAGSISTLRLDVLQTTGDSEVKLPRDALWYLLNEQPHEQFTATSHWDNKVSEQLLRGDGFTWIRRRMNGSVAALQPLPWGAVQPWRMPDGSVRYYITMPEFGVTTWLDPADILHFPGHGFDGVRSMSVIAYGAKNAIGNALAMDDYSGKFFANGAHPSFILEAANKMGEEQIARLQTAFQNKYSGSENYHRTPLVLTEGLKARELSLSAEDAQLLEARKFQVVDIARAFGVPPHMIGETTGSSAVGAGYEQQARDFVMHTLRLHLKRLEQELNRKLFPRDNGKFVRFDLSDLIEGDAKAQADYNRAALGGPGTGQGWMTVDEIRKTKGLAPLGGKASELFDPNAQAEAQIKAAEANKPDPQEQAAAAARNRAELAQIANDAQKPTVVNVASPIVNVTIPEQAPAVVQNTVNVPETSITFEAVMPNHPAPIIQNTVNIEKPDAAVVNVAAPSVVVEAPTVNVAAPVIHNEIPADLRITSMPDRITTSTVTRDRDGNITKAVNTEKDA